MVRLLQLECQQARFGRHAALPHVYGVGEYACMHNASRLPALPATSRVSSPVAVPDVRGVRGAMPNRERFGFPPFRFSHAIDCPAILTAFHCAWQRALPLRNDRTLKRPALVARIICPRARVCHARRTRSGGAGEPLGRLGGRYFIFLHNHVDRQSLQPFIHTHRPTRDHCIPLATPWPSLHHRHARRPRTARSAAARRATAAAGSRARGAPRDPIPTVHEAALSVNHLGPCARARATR